MNDLAVGAAQTLPDVGVGRLDRAPFERRALRNLVLTAGVWVAAVMAGVPLVSVLYLLSVRGGSRLSLEALKFLCARTILRKRADDTSFLPTRRKSLGRL